MKKCLIVLKPAPDILHLFTAASMATDQDDRIKALLRSGFPKESREVQQARCRAEAFRSGNWKWKEAR